MDEAFVIMQIGNPQLDKLWKELYEPCIRECGLDPKRVDKHNEGRILQSEIANFINRSKIISADLSNERPNCYLEVGYAMGIEKFNNLILCAREDHHYESPNYKQGGPKIHFDLSGYGFLWWDEKNLGKFKSELSSKIKQRLELLKTKGVTVKKNIDAGLLIKEAEEFARSEYKKAVNVSSRRFYLSATPIPLIEDVLNPNDTNLAKIIQSPSYYSESRRGWSMGYSGKVRPFGEGLEKEFKDSDEELTTRLYRNGHMEHFVLFGRHMSIGAQSEEEQMKNPIINTWSLLETVVCFTRLVKEVADKFSLTRTWMFQVSFFNCGDYGLQGGHPRSYGKVNRRSLDDVFYKLLVENLEKENDKEAQQLLIRIYNNFGFTEDKIPFFDQDLKFKIT